MKRQKFLSYELDGLRFENILIYEDAEKQPAVIVCSTWMGINSFIREQADIINKWGYAALILDIFGEAKENKTVEEAKASITPLLEDRQKILERMRKALEALKKERSVETAKIAAIGFCFGGTCVLELAKSDTKLSGVVSLHGVLGNPHQIKSKPIESAKKIKTPILLLHGYKDTLSSQEDLECFEKEMDEKGADWQLVIYGEAMHAFTNPYLNRPDMNLQYNEKSAKRAFSAMHNFLIEIF